MNSFARSVFVSVLFMIGCAEASGTSSDSRLEPPRERSRVPAASAEPPELQAIDLLGTLVDGDGASVLGRGLVVVDARGRRFDTRTDDAGSFSIQEVVPPYDLAVGSAAYLDLTRRDPAVRLEERDPISTEGLPIQSLRLAIALPWCRGSCSVEVATASTSGAGYASGSYEGNSEASLSIPHAWQANAISMFEVVDVSVFVRNASNDEFWFARLTSIPASPGEETDVGILRPLRVSMTVPIVIDVRASNTELELSDWAVATSVWLELESGGRFPFRTVDSPSLLTALPKIAGAKWSVTATATRASTEVESWTRSLEASTSLLPLVGDNVVLDLGAASTVERPSPGGILSRHGAGLAWSTDGKTRTARVTLRNNTRNARRFDVVTEGEELSFDRLERLGIERPEVGPHELVIASRLDTRVDEMTDPRARPRARTSATSTERFSFRIVR